MYTVDTHGLCLYSLHNALFFNITIFINVFTVKTDGFFGFLVCLSGHFQGKAPVKRTAWTPEEVQAVERHLNTFIKSFTVPGKYDCDKCLEAEPVALKNRTWKNVKFFVHNRITTNKKKLQHR